MHSRQSLSHGARCHLHLDRTEGPLLRNHMCRNETPSCSSASQMESTPPIGTENTDLNTIKYITIIVQYNNNTILNQ